MLLDEGVLGWLKQPEIILFNLFFNSFYTDRTIMCYFNLSECFGGLCYVGKRSSA